MSAITYDKLKVIAPWEIHSIYELNIKKTLNQHGELYIKALLTEEAGAKAGLQETTDDQIKIYSEDGTTKKWLFKGRLKEVDVNYEAGLCTITACFLSETCILDSLKKNRSFQNTELTYDQIVTKILGDYPDLSMELTAEQKAIDGPIIQYQETDWQFIKRLASYLETVIVPDSTMEQQIFSFGYPAGQSITLSDDSSYATGKDLKAYYVTAEVDPSITENQFAYYEVETYEPLNMGDTVTFKEQEMQVSHVHIELKQSLLVYHTTLVKKIILRQNPIYNNKLQGISLKGTILEGQDQQVKLHLDIDKEQNPDEAYWYPFAPSTTDALYLMPQIGTMANLYIPGKQEQKALVTGCIRTNGAECEQTSDPNTRYLATEYGQELRLAPDGIYLTAGNENLCLQFDDQEGVILKSHKGMKLQAKEEIILEAEQKVIFRSPNQVLMATPTGNLTMENEVHLRAPNVHIECTDDTKFSPLEEEAAEEDSNDDIDWSGMWASAKGAVATWWDNIKWEEVRLGAVQAVGGGFQWFMGRTMVGAGYTGTAMSVVSGMGAEGAVPCIAFGLAGVYVMADATSAMAGGLSRMKNGFLGDDKKQDSANFFKNAYPKWFYDGTQLAIGAFSLRSVYTAGIKGVARATLITKVGLYLKEAFKDVKPAISSFCDYINMEGTVTGLGPAEPTKPVETTPKQ